MPLPLAIPALAGIVGAEAVDEIIDAGISSVIGEENLSPEQTLIENKDPTFMLASTGIPAIGVAMNQVMELIKRKGAVEAEELGTILVRHGLEDKADEFAKFARAAVNDKEAAAEVIKLGIKSSEVPKGFKKGTKAKVAMDTFSEKIIEGDIKKAKTKSKRAAGKFKRMGQELGREADTVTDVSPRKLLAAPAAPATKEALPVIGSKFDPSDKVFKGSTEGLAEGIDELKGGTLKGLDSLKDAKSSKLFSSKKAMKSLFKAVKKYPKLSGAAALGAWYLSPDGEEEETPEEILEDIQEIKEDDLGGRMIKNVVGGSKKQAAETKKDAARRQKTIKALDDIREELKGLR
jgi:hypothetical protein